MHKPWEMLESGIETVRGIRRKKGCTEVVYERGGERGRERERVR
jgi:hypothetical protein